MEKSESHIHIGIKSKLEMVPKPGSMEGAILSVAYSCVQVRINLRINKNTY